MARSERLRRGVDELKARAEKLQKESRILKRILKLS